jgi:hypothetical protein
MDGMLDRRIDHVEYRNGATAIKKAMARLPVRCGSGRLGA